MKNKKIGFNPYFNGYSTLTIINLWDIKLDKEFQSLF